MTTENEIEATDDQQPESGDALAQEDAPKKLREVRRFEPGLIRRARIIWACGIFSSDEKIQEFLGIKGTTRVIHLWRKRKMPDGHDWYAFREEWGSIAGPKLEWLGVESELEMRQRTLQMAGRVAAHAMAALEHTEWFDEKGNRVRKLYQYTAGGELVSVKLQGLGPTTFGQVSTALKQAAEVQDREVAAMDELQRSMDDREVQHVQIAAELVRRLEQGGEPLTDGQHHILVGAEREMRGEEETAPEPGALGEGVSEEDELDEFDDPDDDLDET